MAYSLFTQFRTFNLLALVEKVTKTYEPPVLTLKLMQSFVVGKDDEIPPNILSIFRDKEDFIRDFIVRYPTWFSQDLGQIMEQELEDVLEQFRNIKMEVEPATKIVALVTIRDLLTAIHTCMADKEGVKDPFSIDSLLKLVEKSDFKNMGENELKLLKTNYETIINTNNSVDITYPNYIRLLPCLEAFIWRLEARTFYSKPKTKPDILFRHTRAVPSDFRCEEEIKLMAKRIKMTLLDETERPKDFMLEFLNLNEKKYNHVEARRFIDRALLSDLKDPEDFALMRIANKISLDEMKINEAMCKKLQQLGYESTKIVTRFLGKETTKKFEDTASAVTGKLSTFKVEPEPLPPATAELTHLTSHHSQTTSNEEERDSADDKKEDPSEPASTSQAPNGMQVEEPQESSRENTTPSKEMLEENLEGQDTHQKSDTQSSPMQLEPTHEQLQEHASELHNENDLNPPIQNELEQEAPDHQQADDHAMLDDNDLSEKSKPAILEQDEHFVTEDIVLEDYSESEPDDKDEDRMEEEQLREVEEELKDPERPASPKSETEMEELLAYTRYNPEDIDGMTLPMTLNRGLDLLHKASRPVNFEGSQLQFNELVLTSHKMLKKLTNLEEKIDHKEFSQCLNKLLEGLFVVPEHEQLRLVEQRAIAFREKVTRLQPEQLVAQKDDLIREHDSLGVVVFEFQKILQEIERDYQISLEVNRAIENREHLSLAEITAIKNKDQSARYFKDKILSLKIYDIYIMALIAAYKEHDKVNGEPVIDYLLLQEAYGAASYLDVNPERYIKPPNSEFIKKLYRKTKQYIKENFYTLKLSDLQTKIPVKSYKRFIDLTGKFIEYRFKLQERESKKEAAAVLKRKVLKPSGKKSMIHKKLDYHHVSDEYTLSKPAFTNRISKEHRQFYASSLTHYIAKNRYISIKPEKAFKIARGYEKQLFAAFLESPFEYESMADKYVQLFRRISFFKFLSGKFRSKKLAPQYISKFLNCTDKDLQKHEEEFKRVSLQSKNMSKPKAANRPDKLRTDKHKSRGKLFQENPVASHPPIPAPPANPEASLNKTIEPKLTSLLKTSFKEFRVYSNSMEINITDAKKKLIPDVQLAYPDGLAHLR